jgi:hypothetical protein
MRLHVLLGALGLGVLSIAALAKPAQACGGCFQPPTQSGDVITDEKMIFRVTPQATTLYDEIEYSGNPASFGWVLPIRGPVTVGLSSDLLFKALDSATTTTIVAPQIQPCACGCAQSGGGFAAGNSTAGGSSWGGGVTVISQQTVGPYDTVQLKSTSPTALNDWLAANGYVVPNGFQPTIAAYVSEGFDFLALKLAPGQGVAAMRPVRVTTPGAGLSLPLRMVAAGTGATVGVTLWVMADGRYEPSNMAKFTIDPSELTWDFKTGTSDYTQIRAFKEAVLANAGWQIESSVNVSPYQVEGPVMSQPAGQNYPVDADGGADSTSAQLADLMTMFPNGQSDVRVTRMRADLSHAALANDLVVQASSDQSELSNVYQVTKSVNAPSCQQQYCGCGGSSGGPVGGASSGGWLFGAPPTGGTGNTGASSGCTAGPEPREDSRSTWLDLALVGVVAASIVGKRVRRRRTS